MSDKISKGGVVKGPVNMHKALAAGESLKEAQASAMGKGDATPKTVPAKGVK